jgi:hypothetical protein
VIIASTSLQRIPPNIIRVGDGFAGDDRRLFSAPSMAWLEAAQVSQATDGRSAVWISTEAIPEGSQTLQTIADRLRGTLYDFGISLDEAAVVPTGLAGAELAIVAAHGGLLPGGFYFHVIGNDAEFKAAAGRLADAVRGAGVAVLFICSGRRIDSHPMANTTIAHITASSNECRAPTVLSTIYLGLYSVTQPPHHGCIGMCLAIVTFSRPRTRINSVEAARDGATDHEYAYLGALDPRKNSWLSATPLLAAGEHHGRLRPDRSRARVS